MLPFEIDPSKISVISTQSLNGQKLALTSDRRDSNGKIHQNRFNIESIYIIPKLIKQQYDNDSRQSLETIFGSWKPQVPAYEMHLSKDMPQDNSGTLASILTFLSKYINLEDASLKNTSANRF